MEGTGELTLPVTDPGCGPGGKGAPPPIAGALPVGGGAPIGGALKFSLEPFKSLTGALDIATADAGSFCTSAIARVRNPASFALRKSPMPWANEPRAVRVSCILCTTRLGEFIAIASMILTIFRRIGVCSLLTSTPPNR
tara:strand:- start:788 stop:1204 length:417 start_codon:yes stop_codon:yes gene_type:complete